MKHLLLTTIAAVVLVGCGGAIHQASEEGNIEAVKQHLNAGADVNAKNDDGVTPLVTAIMHKQTEITDLLRKHGGKTGEELEAEAK